MSRGQFSKSWEDLDISDNFIFCKVMQDEELCKEVLELLLDIKIRKIEYLKTENPIENFYESRGVRLDVFVKDSDRIFDMEIQTGNYDDLILRSRYYLAATDVATTKRRTLFSKLKESYVLFICKDDPFGVGLPKYSKRTLFDETELIPYDDKTHCVFYNCSGWKSEPNKQKREVLKFIYGLKCNSDSDTVQRISNAVFYAKANSVFKDEYMYLEDVIEEEKVWARMEGWAEGKEKGLAEGLAEGKIDIAKKLVTAGILTSQQIADATGLELAVVESLG